MRLDELVGVAGFPALWELRDSGIAVSGKSDEGLDGSAFRIDHRDGQSDEGVEERAFDGKRGGGPSGQDALALSARDVSEGGEMTREGEGDGTA